MEDDLQKMEDNNNNKMEDNLEEKKWKTTSKKYN